MKKAILLLFVAVAFCASCKKDQKKGPAVTGKTYKVNFDVSGFTQELINHSANKPRTEGLETNDTPPLSSAIANIYYYVFDSGGRLLHYLTQPSSATNFGNIADQLPAGSYTIVLAAGQDNLLVRNSSTGQIAGTTTVELLRDLYLGGYYHFDPITTTETDLPWQDTFYKKIALTVTDSDINQSVTMDRIVSQVTVDITDAIPANAHSITVTARTYRYFFLSSGDVTANPLPNNFTTSGVGPVDNLATTFIIPDAAKGTTDYKVSLLTLNNTDPSSVLINCYDASNNVLGSVKVDNVIMHPNTQTILSGNLFGTSNHFGVTLNGKWDPSTINVPF